MATLVGDLVARGTRSTIHAYGQGAVVKVPHWTTPGGWITSEAEYAEAARGAGAPVPRLLGIERIAGRTASVWERVEGMSMWEQVIDRPKLSAEFGSMLADVQQGLFRLVPPVTLPGQRDRLVSKIRRSAATLDPALGRALELLPESVHNGRLCHGDLHPSNVILSDDGPMIVDWFDASRGDPVADVARTSLLADGRAAPRHLPGADDRTLSALTSAYLSRVSTFLEFDDAQLARWQAIEAVARMAEGVPCDSLFEIWERFENDDRLVVQAAAS